VAAALLVWMGLVLASPATPSLERAADARPVVARVRLGAGDALGERMFGRALHRHRILVGETSRARRDSFDLQRWLRVHGATLR